MHFQTKKSSSLLTAAILLASAHQASAVPIDNIPGANSTTNSLGAYIDTYITAYGDVNDITPDENRLLGLCNDYATAASEASSSSEVKNVISLLEYVSHEEVGAMGSGFTDTGHDQMNSVMGRMQYLRSGAPALASNMLWQSGGAAGDDFSRLSLYSNLSYGDGSKDRTRNEQGFDFDSQALTVGGDYRLSDTLIAGAALGFGQSDVSVDNSAGDTSGDTYSLTGYTSMYVDSWYVDASLGYATHSYDSSRYVPGSLLLGPTQTLTSDTDGDSLTWSLGAGYAYDMYGWTADYALRLDSVSASIDGYRESGGLLALEVGDQDIDSLQGVLSAQFSKAYSTEMGVILPSFGLEIHQEFDDETRVVTAQYALDRFNNQFSFSSDDADKSFYLLSAGGSWVMTQGNQMFLNLDHLVGLDDVSSNTITAGFRIEL